MKVKMKTSKKIIVALSGGVDSAVAAALLKKQGYDVVGVYFRFSESTREPSFQVEKIAKKLGIPLKIVDARAAFKKQVINYFIDSYKKGQTPNPCVVCNKEMKFRLLFDLTKKEKADFVATGHYVRLWRKFKVQNEKCKIKDGLFYKLLEGKDKSKDQSYFLYKLNQKDLARIIFPLGNYKKDAIKKMAKKMKLPIAKSESQDICFIEDNKINLFLKKNIKIRTGDIKDEKGNVLGRHKGLPLYTIGQRKGIEVGSGGPYFVLRKNARKNELIVTNNPKNLLINKFEIVNASWIDQNVKFPLRAKVQIRYHADKIPAIIKKSGKGRYSVETAKKLRAVTVGQAAVFYRGTEALGGGEII